MRWIPQFVQNGLSFVRTHSKSTTLAGGEKTRDTVFPKVYDSTSVTKVKAHFPRKQGKEGPFRGRPKANEEGAATGRPDVGLLCFELGRKLHFCPILRREGGLRLFVGLRKLFRVVDEVQKEDAYIKRRAGKLAKNGGERRAAHAASRRNMPGKMNGNHAAASQRFMGILHQPEAVMAVLNHVGRDRDPLTFIRGRGSLAIPELRLWHGHSGLGEAIGIQANFPQAMLISEAFYVGKGLIPVNIGIAHEGIEGAPQGESVHVGEIVRIGAQCGEYATGSQKRGQSRQEASRDRGGRQKLPEHSRKRRQEKNQQEDGKSEVADANGEAA